MDCLERKKNPKKVTKIDRLYFFFMHLMEIGTIDI
jgi:hypothetical protein